MRGKRGIKEEKCSDDGNSLESDQSSLVDSKNRPSSSGKESLQVPPEPKSAIPKRRKDSVNSSIKPNAFGLRRMGTMTETVGF